MNDLLILGVEVLLKEVNKKGRKTDYDLIGVYDNDQLVSVDSRIPNRLVLEALKNDDIKQFEDYKFVKTEYSYNHLRFDFLLTNQKEKCLLEVKSCTSVNHGVARFPDAITERGRRQVKELMEANKEGYRTCVLIIVQRPDVHLLVPDDETDPDFGCTLRKAVREGVEVYAYNSEFIENRIILKDEIKVSLKG